MQEGLSLSNVFDTLTGKIAISLWASPPRVDLVRPQTCPKSRFAPRLAPAITWWREKLNQL
jgi:hypothetical protein